MEENATLSPNRSHARPFGPPLPLCQPCASAGGSRTPPSALCGKTGTFPELAERHLQTRPLEKRSFVRSQSDPDSGGKCPSLQIITVTKSGAAGAVSRILQRPSEHSCSKQTATRAQHSVMAVRPRTVHPHLPQTPPLPEPMQSSTAHDERIGTGPPSLTSKTHPQVLPQPDVT